MVSCRAFNRYPCGHLLTHGRHQFDHCGTKNKLIGNLVCGTIHYDSLERGAGKRLTGFIEQTLPEALIIRDVFNECGDLELDSTSREKLSSHPVLGDQWRHLLTLYGERKCIFNTDLPVRHKLRKCFNVRVLQRNLVQDKMNTN